jgi:hypothetical protein
MKRTFALVVVAAVLGALVLSGQTHASGIFPGSISSGTGPVATAVCVSLPKQTPCPTAGPETITPLFPVKTMSVSGATAGPFGVNSYDVNIVSQVGCFGLTEPILVTALGNSGEAVFRQVAPPVVGGNPYMLSVVPDAQGNATLSLEVWAAKVGPAGLTVKAIWPDEGVEQFQTIIAPAPLPTATGAPATAVATAVPPTAAPTPAASTTPAPTDTPAPTVTPTAVPLTLATCFSARSSAIDIRSAPGASCTLSLTLNQGLAPGTTYNQGAFIIPSTGVGEVPFTPAPTSSQGTAVTTCTAGSQTLTDTLKFSLLTATATPTPASTP